MRQTLSGLLRPEAVLVPLRAGDPEAAVSALTDALPLDGAPADRQALKAAVMTREAAGSTGIGAGIAIPHARWPKAVAPIMAAGLAAEPIDFKAADGRPVSLVFLLAVPATDYAAHLKALAAVSRIGSNKALLRKLLRAESPGALFELLAEVPL